MVSYKDDLYSAIDDVKEEAMVVICFNERQKRHFELRGEAREVKKMLKDFKTQSFTQSNRPIVSVFLRGLLP